MSTYALFHSLLSYAIENHASDLHLISGMSPKLRIRGEIQSTAFPILLSSAIQEILNEIMPERIRKVFDSKVEIDFAFVDKVNAKRRYRVTAFQHHHGLSIVFRILPIKVPSLDELNLPEVIKEISLLKQGLVLVTGATGSGKTTTLAAMLKYQNQQQCKHIITIEDPIEFVHTSQKCLITQREVYRDTISFQQALSAALRADPDVILVGELRNLETIRLALTAAETGHLVLGTLHTASAEKTLHRIIDVFPGDEKEAVRMLLSESLEAIITQKLITNKEGNRIPLVEILRCTTAIRHLIRENKTAQIISAMQTGKQFGMQTFEQHLSQLSM
jgi:twitching motility protein PilT